MNYRLSTLFIMVIGQQLMAQTSEKLPLWPNGAPGFEHIKNEPEIAREWYVRNIHNPSITIYPAQKPNGSAILICPGGGFRDLVIDEEGTKAAKFLNELGVTTAVLKYRLFRRDSALYTMEHPTQDVLRAMRLFRSKADELGFDPNRLGVMGFSAGGEVINSFVFNDHTGDTNSEDAVERTSANANFHIQIYPGPLGVPDKVTADAPPVFLLAANKDECCSASILKLLRAYREAGADVEAHFYAKSVHGFNMGDRSEFTSIKGWPQRLADWLVDNKFFE